MAARGPQNGRRGPERWPPLDFDSNFVYDFGAPDGHFECLRRNDRIKKLILQKLIGGSNNLRYFFSDTVGYFGLSGWLGVAGGAALQAVSECPRCRKVGIFIAKEYLDFQVLTLCG